MKNKNFNDGLLTRISIKWSAKDGHNGYLSQYFSGKAGEKACFYYIIDENGKDHTGSEGGANLKDIDKMPLIVKKALKNLRLDIYWNIYKVKNNSVWNEYCDEIWCLFF